MPEKKKTASPKKSSSPAKGKTAASPAKKKKTAESVKKTSRKTVPATKRTAAKKRAAPKKPISRKARRRAKQAPWAAPLLVISVAAILCCAMLVLSRVQAYDSYKAMRAPVDVNAFYAGTLIDGVDVSGKTVEEVRSYFSDTVEPGYENRKVTISADDDTYTYSCSELGYESNAADVIGEAWAYARFGPLKTRYRQVVSLRGDPVDFDVDRTLFDAGRLRKKTNAIAKEHSTGAKDAYVTGFDTETLSFTFNESGSGSSVDSAKLYRNAAEALENGGGTISAGVEEIEPETTVEDIRDNYGMITSAKTNASSSSANRLSNIKLALKAINGTCLAPGETFSFNKTVGKRTASRGYKKAPVFSAGEVGEGIGGGICQVSTTLFNAAMKADLELVERTPHSRTVNYVDKGKDAAVDWPNQDMKFKNNTDGDIYIMAKLTKSQRVLIGIYGRKLDYVITIDTKTTETMEPETQYVLNPVMKSGKKKVTDKGRTGYKAVAYRVYSDFDGNELRRELLCKSTYRSSPKIVEYGP